MDELCKLLSQTHLSSNIISIDDLTQMIQQINIKNDDLEDFTNLFNDMQISEDEIIEIANKSNNLSEFCQLMLSIVNQRGGKRCYQLTFDTLPSIY
jgi:hypothetical protein